MIRRPPRSTLFPTRRSSDLDGVKLFVAVYSPRDTSQKYPILLSRTPYSCSRSEEHTSELQSQSNLVCRLLLEKKKKKPLCNTHVSTIPTRIHHRLDSHTHDR